MTAIPCQCSLEACTEHVGPCSRAGVDMFGPNMAIICDQCAAFRRRNRPAFEAGQRLRGSRLRRWARRHKTFEINPATPTDRR